MPLSGVDLLALIVIGSIGLLLAIVVLNAARRIEAAAATFVAQSQQRRPGHPRGATVTRMISRNPLITKAPLPVDYVDDDEDTAPLPIIQDEP